MRNDDAGASAPVAFAMGGVVLILIITTMLVAVQNIGDSSQTTAADSASRRSQAEGLASLLLDSPGLVDCGAADGTPCAWAPPYPLEDFTPDQYRLEGPSIWEIGHDDDQFDADPDRDAEESKHDADNVVRLGLRHASKNLLDITKFRNLKDATYADSGDPAEGDNRVNYEEARQMFGLDQQGLDFHIRTYPTFPSVDELLLNGQRDQHLRITYIGNALGSADNPTFGAIACGESPFGDQSWRYAVPVKNTGTTLTQFQVELTLDDPSGGPKRAVKDQSSSVAAGDTVVLYFDLPDDAGGDCHADTEIDLSVSDISTDVTEKNLAAVNPTPDASSPGTTATHAFFIEVAKMHYDDDDTTITVQWEGTGNQDEVHWELYADADGAGALIDDWTAYGAAPQHQQQAADRKFTLDVPAAGDYRLVAWPVDKDGVDGPAASQQITVLADPSTLAPFGTGGGVTFDDAVEREVSMLESLMQRFCPADYNDKEASVMTTKPTGTAPTWDPWSEDAWDDRCGHKLEFASMPHFQPGDVFWDDKKLLQDELCKRLLDLGTDTQCNSQTQPATLAITNVLVVGSNVDHNALTQGSFKWPLQKWVEAGGAVIAFGSPESSTQWLQPIFHVGQAPAGGPLSTPDTSHPLLTTPNDLDYLAYDTAGKGWKYTGQADKLFADVVKADGDPITAVSDPGAFGGGTVVITSWRPYDVYGSQDAGHNNMEGLNIMANFVTQGYRDLYLDYGPPLPERAYVEPAFRFTQIEHEDFPGDLIQLNVAVFVF